MTCKSGLKGLNQHEFMSRRKDDLLHSKIEKVFILVHIRVQIHVQINVHRCGDLLNFTRKFINLFDLLCRNCKDPSNSVTHSI